MTSSVELCEELDELFDKMEERGLDIGDKNRVHHEALRYDVELIVTVIEEGYYDTLLSLYWMHYDHDREIEQWFEMSNGR